MYTAIKKAHLFTTVKLYSYRDCGKKYLERLPKDICLHQRHLQTFLEAPGRPFSHLYNVELFLETSTACAVSWGAQHWEGKGGEGE